MKQFLPLLMQDVCRRLSRHSVRWITSKNGGLKYLTQFNRFPDRISKS